MCQGRHRHTVCVKAQETSDFPRVLWSCSFPWLFDRLIIEQSHTHTPMWPFFNCFLPLALRLRWEVATWQVTITTRHPTSLYPCLSPRKQEDGVMSMDLPFVGQDVALSWGSEEACPPPCKQTTTPPSIPSLLHLHQPTERLLFGLESAVPQQKGRWRDSQ